MTNLGKPDKVFNGAFEADRRKIVQPIHPLKNDIAEGIENFFTANDIDIKWMIPLKSARPFRISGLLTIPPVTERGKAFGNSQRPLKLSKINFIPLNQFTALNTTFRMLWNGVGYNCNSMVQVPSSTPFPPPPAVGLNEYVIVEEFYLKPGEIIDYLFTNTGMNPALIRMEAEGWIF